MTAPARKRDATTTLTRADLKAFDREATDLVMTAQEAGCTARMSSNGHVILRAPNGDTAAVSRNMASPNRSAQNARAQIKRLIAGVDTKQSATPGKPRRFDGTLADALADPELSPVVSRKIDHRDRSYPAASKVTAVIDQGQVVDLSITPPPLPTPRLAAVKPDPEPKAEPYECPWCTHPMELTIEEHAAAHGHGICPEPGCGKVTKTVAGLGPHTVVHKGTGAVPHRYKTAVEAIAAIIAETTGHPGLEARVTELETQLAAANKRADEAEARLALMREALGA